MSSNYGHIDTRNFIGSDDNNFLISNNKLNLDKNKIEGKKKYIILILIIIIITLIICLVFINRELYVLTETSNIKPDVQNLN